VVDDTARTILFSITKSTFYQQSEFMYFVWFPEQMAAVSLFDINLFERIYCAIRTEYLNTNNTVQVKH